MDILIIAHFSQIPSEKRNNRFHYIALELIKEKLNQVEIVTTSFSHATKKQRVVSETESATFPYKFTMIKEPGYSKNVCIKRFYSHWVMAQNLRKYLRERRKPDVIYCAVPSLDVGKVAAEYAEKNGIRFVIDIQDLWPEAFEMVFNLPVISHAIYWPMKRNANYIYKRADEIIAVSKTYCDRALSVNNKCKVGHDVFLGTSLKTYDENVEINRVTLDKNKVYVAYCGTLGHSYDLRCVMDAISILKNEKKIDNIIFVVMGDGPLKEVFEEYAQNKGINVNFTGRLEYPSMCAMLSACDIVVNPITHRAAQSIINKHADYVAAGLPVVSTQENEEYRNLVEQYNMGFNCVNGDAIDLADKLERLIRDTKLRKQLGKNARKCAEEKFDRNRTYQQIVEIIKEKH